MIVHGREVTKGNLLKHKKRRIHTELMAVKCSVILLHSDDNDETSACKQLEIMPAIDLPVMNLQLDDDDLLGVGAAVRDVITLMHVC